MLKTARDNISPIPFPHSPQGEMFKGTYLQLGDKSWKPHTQYSDYKQ